MAWPDSPLSGLLEIAWGADLTADPSTWVWTDETAYWHVPQRVEVAWGRPYRATRLTAASFQIGLKNSTGRFARNANSPLWPYIAQAGTPVRWSVSFDGEVTWHERFSGFIRKIPSRRVGNSGRMIIATLYADGITYLLDRGEQPQRSCLYRFISASDNLAGYWACEDGDGSTRLTSAIPGDKLADVSAAIEFVDPEQSTIITRIPGSLIRLGSGNIVSINGASVSCQLTGTSSASAWTVAVLLRRDYHHYSSNAVLLEVNTPGGTYETWQMVDTAGSTNMKVNAIDADGNSTTVINESTTANSYVILTLSAQQNGGNIDVRLDGTWTGSIAGTLTGVDNVVVNPEANTMDDDLWPAGHIAIWNSYSAPTYLSGSYTDSYGATVVKARNSFVGEAAIDRMSRIASYGNLTITIDDIGDANPSRSGPQQIATELELYEDAAKVDGGLLHEDGFGLAFHPISTRYNPPVVLTLDASAREVIGPIPDDELSPVNVWTISRTTGSSFTAEDQDSIAQSGKIIGTDELNLSNDESLIPYSYWYLHHTTGIEPNYPDIGFALHFTPDLVSDWLLCREGSRIQIVNPPAGSQNDPIDQIITGAKETIAGRRTYYVSLATAPVAPWLIGSYGPGPDPIGDTLNLNPRIETDTTQWSGSSTTVSRSSDYAYEGTYSLKVVPAGGVAGPYAYTGDGTYFGVDVTAGLPYTGTAWVYSPGGYSAMDIRIYWYTAGEVFISSDGSATDAIPAGEWTFWTVTATAPATAAYGRLAVRETSTPAASDIYYVDLAELKLTQIHRYGPLACELAAEFDPASDTSLTITTTGPLWMTGTYDPVLQLDVGGHIITATTISGTSNPQTVSGLTIPAAATAVKASGSPVDIGPDQRGYYGL